MKNLSFLPVFIFLFLCSLSYSKGFTDTNLPIIIINTDLISDNNIGSNWIASSSTLVSVNDLESDPGLKFTSQVIPMLLKQSMAVKT